MKNFFLIASAFLMLSFASCSDANPVLTVEGGDLQGVLTETKGVIAYKGVPFAAPPVDELRWKAPQPVVPWEGVKIADAYGPAAWQTAWNPESFYGREWRASGSVPFSEDCLYLNIWTPAAGKRGKKLPVAMWIHGGGYREGFAFEPEMDGGEDWASRGVILVSVTYRLGLFGFFSHPLLSNESEHKVSGNYGLMDQAAALKWIYNNIEQFGGDPNNITVFGQSAGAGSVQSLCASPLSRKMVTKAISMSGGGLSDRRPGIPLDTAMLANEKMMAHFEINTLEQMRSLSFEEMTMMASAYTSATGKRPMLSPLIDNYFLTGTFSELAKTNEIPDIPYMFGYTANDMFDMAQAISDFCMLRSETSDKPAFAYIFSRQLPGDDSGAFHSSDLWYIFHSFRHSWRPFNAGDEALSLKMLDFWTHFAKYGNPNDKAEELWTPYTAASPKFMDLDVDGEEAVFSMTDKPEFKGAATLR